MPYLNSERREYLKGVWNKEITGGDINYLFTELLIRKWMANPCYQTIHDLKRATVVMAGDDDFWELRATLLEHGVADVDIRVAAELAYNEFQRRIVADYEDAKAASNGDVYEKAVNDLYENIIGRAVLPRGE